MTPMQNEIMPDEVLPNEVLPDADDLTPLENDAGAPLFSRHAVETFLSIVTPLILLSAWEGAARIGWIDTNFFPSPTGVMTTLWEMIRSGELWEHTSVSIVRILVGYAFGSLVGIFIGVLMGMSSLARAVLLPIVQATFPIPKLAILPLFILIFGLGESSKYAIIAVTVVYMTLINTYEGVRDISPIYLDVGHNYGASRTMMFFDVALPGAMPSVLAGLKISMGVSLLVIVAAEFVGAKSGIGFLIWNSWQVFAVEKMYVGLFMTAILGFATAWGFDLLEKIAIPWRKPVVRTSQKHLARSVVSSTQAKAPAP